MQNLTKEQKDLFEKWKAASDSYYNSDEPLLSDLEFDNLTEQLRKIPQLSEIINSSIQSVDGLVKADAKQEMVSLKKLKFIDESFEKDLRKFLYNAQFLKKSQLKISAKYDGAGIKVYYDEQFNPIRIQTRGGLDVTNLLSSDRNVIKYGKRLKKRLLVGELLIKKKLFSEKYSTEWENPRAAVISILKSLNPNKTFLNDLSFVPYTDGKNAVNSRVWKEFDINDIKLLPLIFKEFKSDNFPYQCDGLVIAFYESGERRIKDNYPLNMVAIKFPGEKVKTKVIGIEWSQKKSGKLTPILSVKPVRLDGIINKAVNAYNYDTLIKNGLGIGAEIMVEKSNDVIPIISEVLSPSNKIIYPDFPYKVAGINLIGDNETSKKFKFTEAIRSFGLEGIGPVIGEQIGLITNYDIIELFNMEHKNEIKRFLGSDSANWVRFKEFYSINELSLEKLIFILQFDNVGETIAKNLARIFLNIAESLAEIPLNTTSDRIKNSRIPKKVLLEFFQINFNKVNESIRKLNGYGIKINFPNENAYQITFDLTGSPDGMTKNEFIKKLKQKNPNFTFENIKKGTMYLFTNSMSSNSSAMNKARKYNIPIILYSLALNSNLF